MTVRAKCNPHTCIEIIINRHNAISEVSLSSRTRTHQSPGARHPADRFWRHMNRVHGSEPVAEQAFRLKQRHRRAPVFLDASADFSRLLGDVHVNRKRTLICKSNDLFQVVKRDSANTMRRHSNPGDTILQLRRAEQCFEFVQIDLRGVFNETNLERVCCGLKTRTSIGYSQECDTNSYITRGANHFSFQQVWIRVSRAVR